MLRMPSRLSEKLEQDQAIQAWVLSTLSFVEPLVALSTLPFFPDYTDHGLQHIQAVLRTADALIPENGRAHLSAGDAAVIITSVLLHDLGMHLTEDGYQSLIAEPSIVISEIDTNPWPEAWEDFIETARRIRRQEAHERVR
jgi:molecular chaperone HtpG